MASFIMHSWVWRFPSLHARSNGRPRAHWRPPGASLLLSVSFIRILLWNWTVRASWSSGAGEVSWKLCGSGDRTAEETYRFVPNQLNTDGSRLSISSVAVISCPSTVNFNVILGEPVSILSLSGCFLSSGSIRFFAFSHHSCATPLHLPFFCIEFFLFYHFLKYIIIFQ